jgi:CBS domain-containing protein
MEADMQVRELCHHAVVTCWRDTSALAMACLMRDHHVGDVIVVDEGDGAVLPVGIVTDRDLVIHVMAKGVAPELLCAGDLIREDELVTVLESEQVYDAIWHMRGNGIRRLPVVDRKNHLVGVVTSDDLTRFLAEELFEVTRVVPRQIKLEESRRAPAAA